jgi:murein DD-endopeptidase MepM/ murein hydrolase activator NlpD
MRPKYSRQTGAQRNRRREPDNDLLSITVALQLLVVVVFLSIFALCKAANTPATKSFVAKVNVVTTTNYDSNKYIKKMITALGINFPEKGLQTENLNEESQPSKEFRNNSEISENNDKSINDKNSSSSIENKDDATSDVQIADTPTIEVLGDSEIKAIADKYSFIVPIKGEYVSLFGTRTDALTGKSDFHSGIDIGANMGTSIKAALAGEVIEVGSSPEYGNYIKLQHNDGMKTVYAYCSTLIAKKGQKVNQGDVIAKVGDTEGLSGSLHFEVWKDNKAVDPEKLLNYLNQ